jgi:hypothetical protein
MVPVIRELQNQQTNPILATQGRSLAFLKLEFPGLQFVSFPGYNFTYPSNGNMVLKMAIQTPGILNGIRKEKKILEQLIKELKIDGVISDNRYGLSTNKVPCIFITHQLRIQVPRYLAFIQPLLYRLNIHYISKFSECWIPDFKDEPNLSGALSHQEDISLRTYFIGPLSRFSGISHENTKLTNDHPKYDFLVLLSGPEPQRTILEEKILDQLRRSNFSAIVVQGKPDSGENVRVEGSVKIYPHLDSEKLIMAFLESALVLSRPGYSTLMDLCFLGKKAVFIPTPGQTEQEYLAKNCYDNKWFYFMDQKNIDLDLAMENAIQFPGFSRTSDPNILNKRIAAFLSSL